MKTIFGILLLIYLVVFYLFPIVAVIGLALFVMLIFSIGYYIGIFIDRG